MSGEVTAENARRPLRANHSPEMCAWCTSAATCEVLVPTPALERRQRYAAACDRHALLHEMKEADRG